MEDLYNAQVAPVSEGTVSERLVFLKRVYSWMTAGLIVCGLSAAICIESGITMKYLLKPMFDGSSGLSRFMGHLLMFAGLIVTMRWAYSARHKPTTNTIAFAAFAGFLGFMISDIIMIALIVSGADAATAQTLAMGGVPNLDGSLVYQALGATVAMFAGLSFVAFTSKKDFSFMRGMLTAALFGLIALMIINIFVQSSAFSMAITLFGIVIFSGYILFDTQKIMRTYPSNEHVAGAITLFYDFVMLFVFILQLLIQLAGNRD